MTDLRKEQVQNKRKRLFDIIQIGQENDAVSRGFDIFIAAVIIVSCLVMFLKTFDQLAPYRTVLDGIENFSLAVFLLGYILRIYTADFLFPNEKRGTAILRFLASADGIVELLTILPFFFLSGFVAFRMLRVVRIFHLFRINASYDSFSVIRSVLYDKRNQLASSVFIILVLMLASSLCMYSAEHSAQPEAFRNAFSGIWWSVSAMLTVGYGDIYPVTTAGRILAIIIAFLGVGVVAIPTGIISAGFVEHYTKASNSDKTPELELQTVLVDIDSAWLGHTVEEVNDLFGIVIVLLERNGERTVPDKDEKIQTGDGLVVFHR